MYTERDQRGIRAGPETMHVVASMRVPVRVPIVLFLFHHLHVIRVLAVSSVALTPTTREHSSNDDLFMFFPSSNSSFVVGLYGAIWSYMGLYMGFMGWG